MRVTVEQLHQLHACEDQVELFEANFPDGAEITRANLAKAVRAGLDLEWYIYYALPRQAWEAYDKATAQAWEAYKKATAQGAITTILQYAND